MNEDPFFFCQLGILEDPRSPSIRASKILKDPHLSQHKSSRILAVPKLLHGGDVIFTEFWKESSRIISAHNIDSQGSSHLTT
jgi:hypothetical protein